MKKFFIILNLLSLVSLTSCTCPKRLQKTNVASELYDFSKYESHDEYVSRYRENIKKMRSNVTETDLIRLAPFSTVGPDVNKCSEKKGVILLHGLSDSPFTMSDISKSIANSEYGRCVIINAPILPGHALVPGASLEVTSKHWTDAVQFSVNDLKKRGATDITIIGFSTGGALALNYALKNQDNNIRLIFASPALALHLSQFDILAVNAIAAIGDRVNSLAYLEIYSDINPYKYESFSSMGVKNLLEIIKDNDTMLKTYKSVDNPTFTIVSSSDSAISSSGVLDLMSKFSNVSGVVYDVRNVPIPDHFKRINPAIEEEKIIDLSHGSLILSTSNEVYGDRVPVNYGCLQYEHFHPKKFNACMMFAPEFYYGALTRENLSKYKYLAKILHNPYYASLSLDILNFLESSEKNVLIN